MLIDLCFLSGVGAFGTNRDVFPAFAKARVRRNSNLPH